MKSAGGAKNSYAYFMKRARKKKKKKRIKIANPENSKPNE